MQAVRAHVVASMDRDGQGHKIEGPNPPWLNCNAMQLLRSTSHPQVRNTKLNLRRQEEMLVRLRKSEEWVTELEPNLLPTTFDPSLGEETWRLHKPNPVHKSSPTQVGDGKDPESERIWKVSLTMPTPILMYLRHQQLIPRRSNSIASYLNIQAAEIWRRGFNLNDAVYNIDQVKAG